MQSITSKIPSQTTVSHLEGGITLIIQGDGTLAQAYFPPWWGWGQAGMDLPPESPLVETGRTLLQEGADALMEIPRKICLQEAVRLHPQAVGQWQGITPLHGPLDGGQGCRGLGGQPSGQACGGGQHLFVRHHLVDQAYEEGLFR